MTRLAYQALGIIAIIGAVFWWIDRQADQRFDRMVEDFNKKQEQLEKKLRDDFKKTTDEVLNRLEQDRKATQDVLERFRNEAGANDPSGIDGEFLRD